MRRMVRLSMIVTLAGCFLYADGYAQGRKKAMKANPRSGPDPMMVRLVRGDTLLVFSDSAFVFNRDAELLRREQSRVDDSLITQLTARVALADSMKGLKDSVISMFREISVIQNRSYDTLRAKFYQADSLAWLSTANTDAALSYVKKVRASSFIASGLTGGVVGGFGIKKAGEDGFTWWPGFVVGAALGVGVNWLLTSLL